MFLAGTWRRFRQYSELGTLLFSGPKRWPHLLKLVSEHRTIFLTWTTVAPAALALALTLSQLLASHLLPEAKLSLGELIEHTWEWPDGILTPVILVLAGCVLLVDVYFLVDV